MSTGLGIVALSLGEGLLIPPSFSLPARYACQQPDDNHVLDLNAGLTQVIRDGDNAFLYGLGRVAEIGGTTEYFLGDALGSVRQLVDGEDIVLAKSYAPYASHKDVRAQEKDLDVIYRLSNHVIIFERLRC